MLASDGYELYFYPISRKWEENGELILWLMESEKYNFKFGFERKSRLEWLHSEDIIDFIDVVNHNGDCVMTICLDGTGILEADNLEMVVRAYEFEDEMERNFRWYVKTNEAIRKRLRSEELYARQFKTLRA